MKLIQKVYEAHIYIFNNNNKNNHLPLRLRNRHPMCLTLIISHSLPSDFWNNYFCAVFKKIVTTYVCNTKFSFFLT